MIESTESAERKEKFTPGPWVFEKGFRFYECFSTQEGRSGFYFEVGENAAGSECKYDEEWMANAMLVKAAPDMYAALENAVKDYGKPGGPWNVPSEPGTWIHSATSALAKARGES